MATPFKLKSGNASAFKNLGSSPVKQKIDPNISQKEVELKKQYGNKPVSKGSMKNRPMSKELTDKMNKKLAQNPTVKKTMNQLSKKGSMPKNFNTTGSSKAGKFAKVAKNVLGKAGRFLGGKALGVAGMMIGTTSKADQPKKGKGKTEYPGGKIDFTKSK